MKQIYTLSSRHRKGFLFILALMLITTSAIAQTWTAKANVPSPRDASVTFTINNKVYLGGGAGNKDFWQYDPAADTWTKLADIPGTTTARGFAVGFAISGKGYIGLGADTGIYDVKRDLWQYDPDANTWTQMADLPAPSRDGAFSFVIGDKAYVGGGNDSAGYLYRDFYEYDPSSNTWTSKSLIPEYIIFPFAFSINGEGYISSGAVDTEVTNTYQYDPSTDMWTSKASFPGTPRQAGSAFVLNNIAYCGLGMSSYTTPYKDFYTYDPVADTWTLLGNFAGPASAWTTAVTYNNTAYVGTGWDFGSSFFTDWYAFTVPTAVSQLSADNKQIICYPNPSTGTIHVQTKANESMVTLYNIIGEKVLSEKLPEDGNINASNLPSGQYLLELTNNMQSSKIAITIAK
ncbi:MAG TPA: kelch repeat-containing protein [Flavipsychrobacter sp.]|nr:kelch repeat-containing protein [Flavipsychrobacter sp.]